VKSREETISPIDEAVRGDILCQISNIALRLGRRVRGAPATETFPGDEAANRLAGQPMRAPWHL